MPDRNKILSQLSMLAEIRQEEGMKGFHSMPNHTSPGLFILVCP